MVSWFDLPQDHQIVSVLRRLTEPLLGPLRRILPSAGGLDFSPLVLLLGLRLIRSLLLSVTLGSI
jgi:YggT family protein